MLYEFQYDISAAFVTLVVLILFLVRHNYKNQSSVLFFLILVFNLISSIADFFANYAISYPTVFLPEINNAVCIIYLLSFNFELLLFVLFVGSVLHEPKISKPINITCGILALLEGIAFLTTPSTHLVIYFDDMLNYCHGPLMNVLYIIFLLAMVVTFILVFVFRNRLNSYQVISLYIFLLGVGACVAFQSLYPRYVIGNLAAGMLMVFLYIVFENPGYYTYRDTQCFNNQAFSGTMHNYKEKKTHFSMAAFDLTDYVHILQKAGHDTAAQLSRKTAAKLYDLYGKNAYCISERTFAVLHKHGTIEDARKTAAELYKAFDEKLFVSCVDSEQIPGDAWVYSWMVAESLLDSHTEEMTAEQIKTQIFDKRLRREEIVHYLEKIIDADGFEVFYQPILDVKQKRFISAEALVRLPYDSPIRSGPEEFIPIAESFGLISQIGESVLRKVSRLLGTGEIRDLGVEYIEVNLSPAQCAKKATDEKLLRIIEENGCKPEWINFEITETAEITSEELVKSMKHLSKCGLKFSIDDYGSGFASAEYLYSLPISMVKIDKSILWNAMKDSNAWKVLRNTMRMLKDLGKEIVVEGVENEEMASLVRENGGDFIQGYLYSKPLPEKDYIQFLRDHQKN